MPHPLPTDPDQRRSTTILRCIVSAVAGAAAAFVWSIFENIAASFLVYAACIIANERFIKNHYRELLEKHKASLELHQRRDLLMKKVRGNIRPVTPLEGFAMREEIDFVLGELRRNQFDESPDEQYAMRDELWDYRESLDRKFN